MDLILVGEYLERNNENQKMRLLVSIINEIMIVFQRRPKTEMKILVEWARAVNMISSVAFPG